MKKISISTLKIQKALINTSQEQNSKSLNKTAGPDDVPYKFLKKLPQNYSSEYLLDIYNKIWFSGKVSKL